MDRQQTSFLDADNIRRSAGGVEYHPLRPFLPQNARVLFLGSFPPQRKRWCMDFYYPNFINDHWRIQGMVFFGDRDHFVRKDAKAFDVDAIVDFCTQKGLAYFDTAYAVRRLDDNASDKSLQVVQSTDVRALLRQLPQCKAVVTTGQKATETLCLSFGITDCPKVGKSVSIPGTCGPGGNPLLLYRLPSSSRAYPLSLDKKVAAYRAMFDACL